MKKILLSITFSCLALASFATTNATRFKTAWGAYRAVPAEPWNRIQQRTLVVAICEHMLKLAKEMDTKSRGALEKITTFHFLALQLKNRLFVYNDSENAKRAGSVACQLYLMKLALNNPLTGSKLCFTKKKS